MGSPSSVRGRCRPARSVATTAKAARYDARAGTHAPLEARCDTNHRARWPSAAEGQNQGSNPSVRRCAAKYWPRGKMSPAGHRSEESAGRSLPTERGRPAGEAGERYWQGGCWGRAGASGGQAPSTWRLLGERKRAVANRVRVICYYLLQLVSMQSQHTRAGSRPTPTERRSIYFVYFQYYVAR